MGDDLNNPLDEEYDLESFQSLLGIEAEFMAAENYHQNPAAVLRRKQAMAFIFKNYRETEHNPDDPFIPLLALTYFDRYYSRLPMQDHTLQDIKLIAISCLSLAWKMRTANFFWRQILASKLHYDSVNLNNLPAVEVMSMELQILPALNWRMRSITAFCFLGFFVSLLNIDNQSKDDLIDRASQKAVMKTYTVIEFTQFKPSIIAASSLVAESITSGPRIDFREAFGPFVNMDELDRCTDQIATKMAKDAVASFQATYGSSASTSSGHERCSRDPPRSSYPMNDDDEEEEEAQMRKR